MSNIRPTEEQQAAVDLAGSGETFVLDAPAGSGKSSTAREMTKAIDGRVLYLVYNRAARDDAEGTFPRSTVIRTTSQLAWHAYKDEYAARMKPGAPRVPARDTARMAGITKPLELGRDITLSPWSIAAMATETIDRYCYSGDVHILPRHVPPLILGLDSVQEEFLRREVSAWAKKIWQQSLSPSSQHKFTMNHAFKLLVMSDPSLGFDTVIVDEAQDSNGATERLVKTQNSQQIVIGDPGQQLYCQPLGTMVEVPKDRDSRPCATVQVAIEDIKVGDLVVTYTNSHVYKKGRPVSGVTRFHHDGRLVRVTTASGCTSAYTDKHHCMVRVGEDLMRKYVVYLMRQGDNFRIGRTRFMYESQHWSFGLALRANAEKADAAWILSVHDTMSEASLAESLAQHQHNIPGVRFEATHERDEMDVKIFWQKYGPNLDAATRCLESYGRLVEFPLWSRRNPKLIGVRRPFATAAANLMDGMTVLPLGAVTRRRGEDEAPRRLWEEVTVTNEWYTGDIVSLEVADHHTYFADGILTHNSWRGATDIMSRFDGPRLQLTQSFRFGEAVADEAAKWLGFTETGITIKGLPSLNSQVTTGDMESPDAVLCRTNGTAMSAAMDFLEEGKRVAIVGGTKNLVDLTYAAAALRRGEKPTHPELVAFKTWGELVAFTEEPGGGDLKSLVGLINQHGTQNILDACKRIVDERRGRPDVLVSTAHRSKGREWGNVQVAGDFREPADFENPLTGETEPGAISRTEAMLHYVTVTRAQEHLDRGGLAWIDRHLGRS